MSDRRTGGYRHWIMGAAAAALAAGCAADAPATEAQAGEPTTAQSVGATPTPPAARTPLPAADRLPMDEVVYFMLPDRFENGSTENDTGGFPGGPLEHGFDPTAKGFYQGGDLVGLTRRLDYIQGMGATAIWLGPIFKNKPVQGGPGQESSGYHGYWITDFTRPDPHLGTPEELKAFVDAAHDRGMKVYMDIITNHTADVISYRECYDESYTGPDKVDGPCTYRSVADYPYTTRGGVDGETINEGFLGDAPHVATRENFAKLTNPNYAYTPYVPEGEEDVKVPAWLNDITLYHNRGETTWAGENSLYGDFAGLDDLFTANPVVVDGMIDIFKDWITQYGVDGFRIDTTRHVNPEFWQAFLPAMKDHAASLGNPHFYMFGEVYDPDPGALARFTTVDGFDQVLDFGFQQAVFEVVSGQEPTERLIRFLRADDVYGPGAMKGLNQPTFLGNHDMGRFSGMVKQAIPGISQDELLARTLIGHSLMFTMRGVPVIYSGDEQGFVSDGNDQLAREPLFPSRTEVYNDNDLIGTDATTADSNFDVGHPIYRHIRQLSDMRAEHAAFRRGAMEPRLSELDGGAFAFSRFDPVDGTEYLVVANISDETRTINTRVEPDSDAFESVYGTCPAQAVATATAQVTVPPFGLVVCRGDGRAQRHVK